jgi:4-alpha-glucanotransferase
LTRAIEEPSPWNALAERVGLQTSYEDGMGARVTTRPDGVRAILAALGIVSSVEADPRVALERHDAAKWTSPLEPAIVSWHPDGGAAQLRVPAALDRGSVQCSVRLESGGTRSWTVGLETQMELDRAEVAGETYRTRTLPIPDDIPIGYHTLRVTLGDKQVESMLIRAPRRAFLPPGPVRMWSLFAPTYALHDERTWGVGDYRLLDEFNAWATGAGAATVATLPLLPTFLEKPYDPSPYAPITRLAWNELFVDLSSVPEFQDAEVKRGTHGTGFVEELRRLQSKDRVEYASVHRLKRDIMRLMHEALARNPPRRRAFEAFLAANPHVLEYGRFRAAHDLAGPWRTWSDPSQLPAVNPVAAERHAYAQFLAHEQLHAASDAARRRGLGFYLDFPLGVHADGYDAWRDRELYADGLSVGAPPDRFFTTGQNWGFSAVDPQRARQDRYASFIRAVRHHCKASGLLRIDHVMGIHRLFVIPRGLGADHGAYLHYPADEYYAILSIESHRHETLLVGEDLGAVPPDVRPALKRHGIHRMFVLQGASAPAPGQRLEPPPTEALASLNTHDMPPFAAFWEALDLVARVQLGLLQASDTARLEAANSRRAAIREAILQALRREGLLAATDPQPAEVLEACLLYLARSPARLMAVNLEDLWLEREPQNLPGTGPERPNWTRRLPRPLNEVRDDTHVDRLLHRIAKARTENLR